MPTGSRLRLAALLAALVLAAPARAVAAPPATTPAPAPASTPHPTATELVALPEASGVALSPDGTKVAYLLRTRSFDPTASAPAAFDPNAPSAADRKAGWTSSTQLWLVPAAGGAPRQLTFSPDAPGAPVWSPDGATLAFVRARDGKPRIHLLPLAGGEPRVVDTGALDPQQFAFVGDGRRMAFTAVPPLTDAERRSRWASGGAIRWDREWRPSVLHVVDLAGGAPVAVTGADLHVVSFDPAPDGSRFAAMLTRSADPYEASHDQRPAIVTPREGAASTLRWLEEKGAAADAIRWSPDGKRVAYGFAPRTLTLLDRLVVREADGPGRWNAAAKLDPTLAGFAWSGNDALLALVAERTASRVLRLAADGASARDTGFSGRVIRPPLSADRSGARLAFLSSTPDDPWSPTVLDARTGRATVVVRTAPEVDAWPRATHEVVRWKAPDGVEIEGILTLPPGAGPGSRPPLWVFPHGGPDDVSQLSWVRWTPSIVARGYAVLRPNYRGGTGYGYDFYAANRGKLGPIEQGDIESGVDALVAEGRVDPARLFYGSWSWGGYLTAWTIGHVHRYRAAVAGAAVVDTVVQYSLSDINHGAAGDWEFGGNPWTGEGHWRSNPVPRLRDARTPTLILHGQADDRVPFANGQILWRALSDVGCEVDFLAYPREPHGFQEPAHWVHMLTAWADWFDRHGGR